MFNKKLILIVMFVLSLFMISAVSAGENTTDYIETDSFLTDAAENELSSEVKNFTELQDRIDAGEEGGTVYLENNYDYDDSFSNQGINITKAITLDGNGFVIDAKGQARIFNISADNVTLKNITFINAKSDDNGGAVYFHTGGNIIDCNFINNSAYNGGAVFFNGTTVNNTIKGYFENNTAERAGGAIYFNENSNGNTIISQFYNNEAKAASGGGIFFHNLCENTIFESIFKYNKGIYGAGIFFYSKANNNRFSSDFSFNVATSCGGAMFFYYTTDGNNFTGYFINNTALGKVDPENGNGGAITFKNTSSNSIFTCDFINNTAALYGGAVNYRQNSSNIIFNSNFTGNKANFGGGVNFYESFENVTFNGEFIGNYADFGGAIAAKKGVIENVSFINNSATNNGGAVYFDDDGAVINCNFTGNIGNYGGAIFCRDSLDIDECTFTSNSAVSGGAVWICENLTVNESLFTDNYATDGSNNILSVTGNVFENNTVSDSPLYLKYANITDNVSDVYFADTVKIEITLTDLNNTHLTGGTVSASVNGKNYSANVSNITTVLSIPNLDAGNYTILIVYTSEEYSGSTYCNFTVFKTNVTITAKNSSYIINYGGKYTITLKNSNDNVISNQIVTFTLDGKSIGTATTDSNGIAGIQLTAKILKNVKAGKKNLVIKVNGDNLNTASHTVKITVNKEKTKITAKKKTFKKSLKVKKYAVKLKNSKGKALKKVKVTLKVKGKSYKAKTNVKGKVIFKIKNLKKKGTFTTTIRFNGNEYYSAVTKTVKIKIK